MKPGSPPFLTALLASLLLSACAGRPVPYEQFCEKQRALYEADARWRTADRREQALIRSQHLVKPDDVAGCARRYRAIEAGPENTDGRFAWTYAYAARCLLRAGTLEEGDLCLAQPDRDEPMFGDLPGGDPAALRPMAELPPAADRLAGEAVVPDHAIPGGRLDASVRFPAAPGARRPPAGQ